MRQKIRRLKLEVVVHPINQARTTTSPLSLPEELPSVEAALSCFR